LKKLLAFLWVLVVCGLYGQEVLQVTVTRIYDGDTFTVELEGDLPEVFRTIGVRIYGIDTPEIRSSNPREREAAREARDFLTSLLLRGRVELYDVQKDKYFRLLAKVRVITSQGVLLISEEMLRSRHAREYYGDAKAEWNFSD